MYVLYELMGTTFVRNEQSLEKIVEFLNNGITMQAYKVLEVRDDNNSPMWRNQSIPSEQKVSLDFLQQYSPARG
jgi:hypothetical protein